jgi:hypothetical protein
MDGGFSMDANSTLARIPAASCAAPGFLSPRSRLLAVVLILASALSISGCARKKTPNPVDAIKAIVPRLQEALNRRDIAALQRLGTSDFPSNRFLIDVFEGAVSDTIALSIAHLRQVPGEAQLVLTVTSLAGGRELTLTLTGDGTWRIHSYQIAPMADSVGAVSPPPDSE